MKGQKFRIVLAATFVAACMGATQAHADSCSASLAAVILKSSGGTCGQALSLNEEFTMTYRLTNASIIDDGGSPNNGDPVAATIQSTEQAIVTLAQETASVGGTALPDVLEFVPVCPVGSVSNAGSECNDNADCGGTACGCQEAAPGVRCVESGGNAVNIEFDSDLDFDPSEAIDVATIRVRVTDTVDTGDCGQFFTRFDTTGDILETEDAACDGVVTAGAQASAALHAPECASDADCGDSECNVCADQGTDNHCEVANIGEACGTDSDPDDCQTPACVNDGGVGECQQNQNDVTDGTACDDGENVDCTDDECVAGECTHTPDDSFCDDEDSCTSETCDAQNDCVYEFICEGESICRSPGYWGTHAGTEKNKSVNVAQEVIDAVGGSIEVCGQTITSTDSLGSLDSSIEGICVKVKGVRERQLYRQLVAATLNCAVSGGNDDCETLLDPFLDVSYDECSDLCDGQDVGEDGPTVNECIGALDCYNNGGHMIDDACVYGLCSGSGDGCNVDDDCEGDETCDLLPNCHELELCNEELGVCPKGGPAGSSTACKEARANDCTIDDCN